MGVTVRLLGETAVTRGPSLVELGKVLPAPAFSQLVARTTEVPRGGENAAEVRPASRLAGRPGRGVRVTANVSAVGSPPSVSLAHPRAGGPGSPPRAGAWVALGAPRRPPVGGHPSTVRLSVRATRFLR